MSGIGGILLATAGVLLCIKIGLRRRKSNRLTELPDTSFSVDSLQLSS